jgi:hypothetical protein
LNELLGTTALLTTAPDLEKYVDPYVPLFAPTPSWWLTLDPTNQDKQSSKNQESGSKQLRI